MLENIKFALAAAWVFFSRLAILFWQFFVRTFGEKLELDDHDERIFKIPRPIKKKLVTRDNVEIDYYVVNPNKEKVMVFCSGLGIGTTQSMVAFYVFMKAFGLDDFTYIAWDYR